MFLMPCRYSPILVGVVLAAAGCSQQDTGSVQTPEVLQAGEVIQRAGVYLSPHEQNRVEVLNPDGHGVQVNFAANNDQRVPSSSMTLDGGDSWFIAWDDSDRLWLYTDVDGVITFSRETTTNVGAGGGWEGIPDGFLEELPEQCQTVYQNWSTAQGD
jgi:hypothetical protein